MHRTSTALAAATVALGSALCLTVVASPAEAATSTFRDAHGDMAHGADLWSARVVNDDVVRVRLHTRDLRPSFRTGSSVTVWFDTDPARPGPEYAFLAGMFDGTDYALVRTDGWRTERRRPVAEGHYLMRLDYRRDLARITISRSALGDPDALRIAVRTGGVQADGDTVRDWLGSRRSFTPWVRRG